MEQVDESMAGKFLERKGDINNDNFKKTLRTCDEGHKYYKSSDCPTCPVCEQERNPEDGFLSLLSAPARRALEHNGVTSLQQLTKYSEKEILKFHGMGPGFFTKTKGCFGDKWVIIQKLNTRMSKLTGMHLSIFQVLPQVTGALRQ